VNIKEQVNSAKTSLNSFSSVLEKKRQQFKEKIVKKGTTTDEAATDKTKTDENIDKAAEADFKGQSEQQQE